MRNKLDSLTGYDLEDELWNFSLTIHTYSIKEQNDYFDYLERSNANLPEKIFFRSLTNMLHFYYSQMIDVMKDRYISMLTAIDLSHTDQLTAGEIFEVLGIVIKGCTQLSYYKIVDYVLANYSHCLNDFSSIISLCNCIRYIYPELKDDSKDKVTKIIYDLERQFSDTPIASSISITVKSLQGESV